MYNKTVKFEYKIDKTDEKIVEAYASIFGNKDSEGDVVNQGAFKKTIHENAYRIKPLFNHNVNSIIGKTVHISEDSTGLYTKTKFVDTPLSNEIYTLIKENILNELSIGYNIIKYSFDRDTTTWYLEELKLYEYSFVTFAANPKTHVTSVKNIDINKEYLESKIKLNKNINYQELYSLLCNHKPQNSTCENKKPNNNINNLSDLNNYLKNLIGG